MQALKNAKQSHKMLMQFLLTSKGIEWFLHLLSLDAHDKVYYAGFQRKFQTSLNL